MTKSQNVDSTFVFAVMLSIYYIITNRITGYIPRTPARSPSTNAGLGDSNLMIELGNVRLQASAN